MAKGPTYKVAFRRRREQKTNYRGRLRLLQSKEARLVVRTSSRNTVVQVVKYDGKGDKTVATGTAVALRKLGWKAGTGNVPSSYMAGFLCGANAKKSGIKKAVLDIGVQVKSRRIFAALRGAIDAGLEIPHGEIAIPEDMILGKHIASYMEKAPKALFSNYKKSGLDSKSLVDHINKVKSDIQNTGVKKNA